jgi:hypothetical protein
MICYLVTTMDYTNDQEQKEMFFATKRAAVADYEEFISGGDGDDRERWAMVEQVRTCSKRAINLLNRDIETLKTIRDSNSERNK